MKLFIRSLLIFFFFGYWQKSFGQEASISQETHAQKKDSIKTDDLFYESLRAKVLDDNKKAITLMEEFTERRPDIADGFYELAKLYEKENTIDKADQDIQKAIALNTSNKWYQAEYASILAEKQEYGKAADIIGKLAASERYNDDYLLEAIELYEHANDFQKAIDYIDKLLKTDGPDEELLMGKMELYLKLNNANRAAETVEELIKANPTEGKYYKLLGELYDNNKMHEKATAVYERAMKALPNDVAIESGLAEHYAAMKDSSKYLQFQKQAILGSSGDVESQLEMLDNYLQSLHNDSMAKKEGLELIRALHAKYPSNAGVLAVYASILDENNRPDSALFYYKKSLAIDQSDLKIWEGLLSDLAASGKTGADSLLNYSARAIRLFPTQAVLHYFSGIGYENKNDHEHAIKAINRAIDLQPDDNARLLALLYGRLAEIYNTTRQYTLSDSCFSKSLSLFADDAATLNNYSYYLSVRKERLDEAEKMSKKSLTLEPDVPTFLDTYGWILYQEGKYDKAKEYIEKAVKLSKNDIDATLYDHLGDVYYHLNQQAKAIENWSKAKEKGVEDPDIDKKIKEAKP
jgi:tetratricopeptide (TPR) repeat protein